MVDMRILSTGRKKVRLAAFQVLQNLFVDMGVIYHFFAWCMFMNRTPSVFSVVCFKSFVHLLAVFLHVVFFSLACFLFGVVFVRI